MPFSSVKLAYVLLVSASFAPRIQAACPRLCYKDLPNFLLHPTIGELCDVSSNTTYKILQHLHCLLPHIPEVMCAPSTPLSDRINIIKLHCSNYLSHSLHNEVFANAPDHFHLLPSILSSQTSYPLIGLCRSNPHNRLLIIPLHRPSWPHIWEIRVTCFRPLHISMVNIYKVLEPWVCCLNGVWVHPL